MAFGTASRGGQHQDGADDDGGGTSTDEVMRWTSGHGRRLPIRLVAEVGAQEAHNPIER